MIDAGTGAGSLQLMAAHPALFRLTVVQYQNTLHDLFGDIALPTDLEADTSLKGFTSIGATQVTIARTTAEKFEAAALSVAHDVFSDSKRRAALVTCTPKSGSDPCVREFLASFGKRVWRRPLTAAELDPLAQLVSDVGASFSDTWAGLEYATAALLQSPYFLFRVDRGEPDPSTPGQRRYSSWEMASRLSFALWDSAPDAELLAAADRDELTALPGLRQQAARLIASPRFRPVLTRYLAENLELDRLDSLSKDPAVYPQMSSTLATSMRGELTHMFEHIVFDQDSDVRNLFDTPTTFVNAELAALYGMSVPSLITNQKLDHFVEVTAPSERRGLLGTAAILAMYANTTTTSPTRRGKFVRTRLLCQEISPPPPGVITQLPPAKPNQTMRERLAAHRSNAVCASCHDRMDPIGLALEHFDGIGAYRSTDHGATLDVTGNLDGMKFDGPVQLIALLKQQPGISACIVRQLYRFTTGHEDGPGEQGVLSALVDQFVQADHRLGAVMLELVTSDGFRYAGAPD